MLQLSELTFGAPPTRSLALLVLTLGEHLLARVSCPALQETLLNSTQFSTIAPLHQEVLTTAVRSKLKIQDFRSPKIHPVNKIPKQFLGLLPRLWGNAGCMSLASINSFMRTPGKKVPLLRNSLRRTSVSLLLSRCKSQLPQ